ncbi:hypothetical protein R6Z07F_020308 [Ovis aries]
MNLFIYVLLLSIWTNSCLDRNESNGSATAVTTRAEFKQTKLEELKRRLLIVVIGALITGYIVTCSCFLHYSCDSEEAHNAAKVKKEDMTIKASSCLDRNESNGSASAVSTHAESKQGRIQGIRKYLLIVLTVILIIGFIIRCYFFIQYIRVGEESHRATIVKKEGITEASSTSSKISFTDSKLLTADPGNPEKQSVLSSIDKSSGPSSPQKASVPSRAKKDSTEKEASFTLSANKTILDGGGDSSSRSSSPSC